MCVCFMPSSGAVDGRGGSGNSTICSRQSRIKVLATLLGLLIFEHEYHTNSGN